MITIDQLLNIREKHPRVNTDTRKVSAGDLFFALKGDRFDGNLYAAEALSKGAAYAVIDNPDVAVPGDERYLLVPDTLLALQQLATAYRQTFTVPVFGLTGSNGKTTTKELIAAVLSTEKITHATAGNFNNHIGVPLTLLAMPRQTEIAVVEMGANQPGDIAELAAIAEPSHGLITNVGAAHLEKLLSLEGVRITKGALFDFLRANGGTAFVNLADHRVAQTAEGMAPVVTYGTDAATFQCKLLSESLEGMTLEVTARHWPEKEIFTSRLGGAYNALNILVAIAVGDHFGISRAGIRQGIFNYLPENQRSQLIDAGAFRIWLDAYNANPSSMRASVEHALRIEKSGVTLILGDMLELGEAENDIHREMGEWINTANPHLVIGIGPRMKHLVAAITGNTAWFPDGEAALPHLGTLLQGSALVVIKGSRGMKLEQVLPHLLAKP